MFYHLPEWTPIIMAYKYRYKPNGEVTANMVIYYNIHFNAYICFTCDLKLYRRHQFMISS